MRCEDIEALLNEHADAALSPAQRQAVDAHLATCEDCRGAWLAAQALRAHRALPMRVPPEGLFARLATARHARTTARPMSPWVAAIGGAFAAGLAIVAFDYFYSVPGLDRAPTVPSLTMALNETRDVSVTIDSPEAFMDVDIRVVLAGGIELEDFRGRREVKWKTDLEMGINRLTLPIVASDSSGGRLLIAVGLGDKQRAFVVQIDVNDETEI